MKKINVVTVSLAIGSVIGLSVLILSYLHTAGLFERSGYRDTFAHIGVIGFELVFILGTGVSIWSKWQGVKVATSTQFALGLGVCINLYSNITSGIAKDGQPLIFLTIKGIPIGEPVLIGALIPCLFVVAEMVISDAISKSKSSTSQEPAYTKPEDNRTNQPEPAEDTPTTKPDLEPEIETLPAKKTPIIPPEPLQPIPLQEPAPTPTIEPATAIEDNQPPAAVKEKTTANRKAKSTKRKPPKKKVAKPKKTAAEDVDYNAIIEVAKRLQAEHEKVGRDRLAKEAGTTPHYARIALAKLEQQEAEKPKLALAK